MSVRRSVFQPLIGILDILVRDAVASNHPLAASARDLERLLVAIGASDTATEIRATMLNELDLVLRHTAERARCMLRFAGWGEQDMANGYRLIDGVPECGHTDNGR